MVENGFFMLLPDEKTTQVLKSATGLIKSLHLTVLVVEKDIIQLQKKLPVLKTPVSVVANGISLLPKRDGNMVTVLNVEHKPCADLKASLVIF